MFQSILLACVFLAVSPPPAETFLQKSNHRNSILHGGNYDYESASRDTVFLIGPWGSGAQVNGQFQDPHGQPAWNGFTHHDLSAVTESHWHISDYNAADLNSTPDNLAMYCGDKNFQACEAADVVGGYGNNWSEILQFVFTVPVAAEPCTVTISGIFNHNTEPGYDYTNFCFETSYGLITVAEIDGVGEAVTFNHSLVYEPQDFLGSNHDQVRFEINMNSDGGWSDEDCSYFGNGACQFDDLRAQCSNGNFDHTSDFQDGPGDWEICFPPGVGDFADLWQVLNDIDPCRMNLSPQVAFIDDGTKVPDAGPSYCQNWCYGSGGYIVNTTGGAADATSPYPYLDNVLKSPVLNWPASSYNGAIFQFDIYRHEDLSADAPGIFYNWAVRSAVDPTDLESNSWRDRTFCYYGGPDYHRGGDDVSDLLESDRTVVQVQCTVMELGWIWGWTGDDGYPAPYFDNFRFAAFTHEGPDMVAREIDLAQDNFPAGGGINMANLASNNVRFDMAMSKNLQTGGANVPGDSIVCRVVSSRTGGEFVMNRLHYVVDRNPVFDSVRNPDWGASGHVDGLPIPNRESFSYDLPDSGFLFPGDVLHYYLSATDEVNNTDPKTSTLPKNITGFGNFETPQAYNTSFTVNCLPSVDAAGVSPEIIFWNDFGNKGGENEWYGALANLGMHPREQYDIYYTNGPSSGVGNGLGGRATASLMNGYSTLLYTCGNLGLATISNGDLNVDPSADVQLLEAWLGAGNTNAFFTGDNLLSDLEQSGTLTRSFKDDFINVTLVDSDIRPLINNQTTPVVLPVPDNGVFFTTPGWIAYGGCMTMNSFDAVVPGDGAQTLARFTNPSGTADYIYSAATLNQVNGGKIISLPCDFMSIYTDPSNPVGNGLASRTNLLGEILEFFLNTGEFGIQSDVPSVEVFSARNYPNPFNPSTRVEFHLPQDTHLTVKVFNIRGELVKTLADDERKAGAGHVVWDGTNERGYNISSGVYFYEARAGVDVLIGKMVMVK